MSSPRDLPSASDMQRWLTSGEWARLVDSSGRVHLTGLSPQARDVVELAHALAQQRRTAEIPSRLMLTAFLIEPTGFVSELCRTLEVDTRTLAAALLASSSGDYPERFLLSTQACQRIVLPTLTKARELPGAGEIGLVALFVAFEAMAPPELRTALAQLEPPLRLNLSELGHLARSRLESQTSGEFGGLEDLSAACREVLKVAGRWARIQGRASIATPHLLAALLVDFQGPLVARLTRTGRDPVDLLQRCLALVRPNVPVVDGAPLTISPAVDAILQAALRLTRGKPLDVTVSHLAEATLSSRDELLSTFVSRERLTV